jgi:hypothetical protein
MALTTEIAGVRPLANILPVSSVAAIGDPAQVLDSSVAQFTRGESLPLPNFSQLPQNSTSNSDATSASFSPTAFLIDGILKQARAMGVSTTFEAKGVVTRTPQLPKVAAEDLKDAVTKSGLFYESHLGDFAEGFRTLAEIKQEPQSYQHQALNALLPQQLAILEHQQFAWRGEVWHGQQMDWNIYLQDEHKSAHGDRQTTGDQKPIASDLTLHLPHLGKVTARLTLVDGRMRISMLAEAEHTVSVLKAQSNDLTDAIEKNGQLLEGFMVTQHA